MGLIGLGELVSQIETLSSEELQVLESLHPEKPMCVEELASDLFALPKDVYDSIEKLRSLSFVEFDKPKPPRSSNFLGTNQVVVLTDIGRKAQALTSLGQGSSQSSKQNLRPRYKK